MGLDCISHMLIGFYNRRTTRINGFAQSRGNSSGATPSLIWGQDDRRQVLFIDSTWVLEVIIFSKITISAKVSSNNLGQQRNTCCGSYGPPSQCLNLYMNTQYTPNLVRNRVRYNKSLHRICPNISWWQGPTDSFLSDLNIHAINLQSSPCQRSSSMVKERLHIAYPHHLICQGVICFEHTLGTVFLQTALRLCALYI